MRLNSHYSSACHVQCCFYLSLQSLFLAITSVNALFYVHLCSILNQACNIALDELFAIVNRAFIKILSRASRFCLVLKNVWERLKLTSNIFSEHNKCMSNQFQRIRILKSDVRQY